jgi:hypothetical protein
MSNEKPYICVYSFIILPKMENKSSNRLKHAMTYGSNIGIGLVVYYVLLDIAGLYTSSALGIVQYAVLCGGIYFGTKAYRDKELGGHISYGNALVFGLIISIFAGIIVIFFNLILMRYIDPGLVDKVMAVMEERLQNGWLSRMIPADQMDVALDKSRESLTSVWSIPSGVFVFSLIGFIFSLITSAFLKKEPNPFA